MSLERYQFTLSSNSQSRLNDINVRINLKKKFFILIKLFFHYIFPHIFPIHLFYTKYKLTSNICSVLVL